MIDSVSIGKYRFRVSKRLGFKSWQSLDPKLAGLYKLAYNTLRLHSHDILLPSTWPPGYMNPLMQPLYHVTPSMIHGESDIRWAYGEPSAFPIIYEFPHDTRLFMLCCKYWFGNDNMQWSSTLIFRHPDHEQTRSGDSVVHGLVDALRRLAEKINETRRAQQEERRAEFAAKAQTIFLPDGSMDDLVEDITLFLNGRDVYKDLGLPWKRGYLFYGPPGNGKTAMIRNLSRRFGLSIQDLMDFRTHTGKIEIPEEVVEDEAGAPDSFNFHMLVNELYPEEQTPTLYYLEDIEKTTAAQDVDSDIAKVTHSDVLRALDGVNKIEGALVVATTNNIKQLHEAILARPGRFDRVLEFPKPKEDRIVQYLEYRQVVVRGMTVQDIAKRLRGVSMAFVEEFVKVCRLHAMSKEISPEIANKALDDIKKHNEIRDQYHNKVGFE